MKYPVKGQNQTPQSVQIIGYDEKKDGILSKAYIVYKI